MAKRKTIISKRKNKAKEISERISKEEMQDTMLFEVAWEVCNQVGGIYTVIRSKVPSVVDKWGNDNYCLVGPYVDNQVLAVFEPTKDRTDAIGRSVKIMEEMGIEIHYGRWLVSGRPKTVLINPYSVFYKLGEIKYGLWENQHIGVGEGDELIDKTIAFGFVVKEFFRILSEQKQDEKNIIAHFHEWMVGTPIPELRRLELPIKIVFTTHATLLGRYLAMNDPMFYNHLPFYDWVKEAKQFNVETIANIERAATHGAHVFTTVSHITAKECTHLLGRVPDVVLPNGLNIERYEALHQFQNLHLKYKEKIHEFVMGHFFQSYSFDLDKTLYFFTSGRFEYKNKGYDLTLEALARLNWKMQQSGMDITVVAFFITRRPYKSFNAQVLHSKALLEEIQRSSKEIQEVVGRKLFYSITAQENGEYKLPNLNDMIEDYNKIKLRRNVQSWQTNQLPTVITHDLKDDNKDEILRFLRTSNMVNNKHDKVKIVYHPDFVAPSNPLFRMEYSQFVRGCHLGVFPSYYEPWGYTPLECAASGVPSVTSDLAGFGSYVTENIPEHDDLGIYVIKRKHRNFYDSAEELANIMFRFVCTERRDRIKMRNEIESSSVQFDWNELGKFYDIAYKKALQR